MTTRHVPAPGQDFFGQHQASPDCACKPVKRNITKQNASGRGGGHQGYKIIRTDYIHNVMETA